MDTTLRSRVIRLAAIHPQLRPTLLPILRQASGISIGDTVFSDNKRLEIHRYMHAITVLDLTNAGKRGKTCTRWTLHDIQPGTLSEAGESLIDSLAHAVSIDDAFKILAEISATQLSGSMRPELKSRELRSIDVFPATITPIHIRTPEFELKSTPTDFHVFDLEDRDNLPACIPAIKGGKTSIKEFFQWASANQAEIEKMSYKDIIKAMDARGIRYHSYCRMD